MKAIRSSLAAGILCALSLLTGLCITACDEKASSGSGTGKAFVLEFRELSFAGNGYFEISADDGGSYAAPHWQDNTEPPNASAADPKPATSSKSQPEADHNFPVGYVVKSKPEITVKLKNKNGVTPPSNTTPKIRGSISGKMVYPETTATLDASGMSAKITCTDALPDTVGIYWHQVKWEYTTDGATWSTGATSNNRVYVTLKSPTGKAYETVADVSCRAAAGKSDPDEIRSAVWAKIATRNVSRKTVDGYNQMDGMSLKYWYKFDTYMNPPIDVPGLLADANGNGACGAWTQFLQALWTVQGLDGGQAIEIRPNVPGAAGFLVNNVTFKAPNPALTPPWQWDGATDVLASPIAGQNNASTPAGFAQHYIVLYGGKYYDPSYGLGPFNTAFEHEKAICAGFVDSNNHVQPKDSSKAQLTYTPYVSK